MKTQKHHFHGNSYKFQFCRLSETLDSKASMDEKAEQVVIVESSPEKSEQTISNLKFWLLTSVLFIGCIANGLVDTVRSITFPLMKEDLHLNYSQYGMLVGMGQFTYLIWALAIAFGMEHWGFKGPFFVSFIFSILGSLGTAYTRSFWVIMCLQFFAACVTGTLDDGCSALAVLLFKKYAAALFSLMTAMYGLGAFIGPLFAEWVYRKYTSMSYRGVYIAICIPLLVMGIYTLCVPFAIKKPAKSEQSKATVLSYLFSPTIWYLALMFFFLVVAERGTLNWGTMYVVDVLKLSEAEGAKLNSRFFLIYTLARIFGGIVADWMGPFTMLYVFLVIAMTLYIVGFALGVKGLWVLPFTGAFVSLFYTAFVMVCKRYGKEHSSLMVACLLPMQALIAMVGQWLFGVLNDKYGPKWAYWFSAPACAIALVMLVAFHVVVLKKEKTEEKEKQEGLLGNAM